MRYLVLGPDGQLGRDFARVAADAGAAVEALDRRALDLADPDAIEDALAGREFDVLVNGAAYTDVDGAETDCGPAFAVNARAPERLAAACRERGARLLQPGTDYVFDGAADAPYRPTDAPGPLNVYGASKLVGERLALRAWPDGVWVVRTSSVFGLAGALRGGGNFVETVLRRAGAGEGLRVVDDVVMAPTYARDLAEGLLRLAESDAPPGVYHLTNRGRASWHELAATVVAVAGLDAAVEAVSSAEYPRPARRPAFSVLDTTAAEAVVGAMPGWRDGVERYLAERTETEPEPWHTTGSPRDD